MKDMDTNLQEILTFVVEGQRFAIQLHAVERILRALEVTKLTDSPEYVEGLIDYYGEVIAVINLRKRLGYPLKELRTSDRFIIAKTMNRKLALIVDEVEDVLLPNSQDLFDSKDIDGGLKFLNILRDDNGIILLYDIENLLKKSEQIELEHILEANSSTSDVL